MAELNSNNFTGSETQGGAAVVYRNIKRRPQLPESSPEVTRETVLTNALDFGTDAPKQNEVKGITQSKEQNVLNDYRVSTYNFTLAAIRKNEINDPKLYMNKKLDLVVLKSGGKGTTGLVADNTNDSRVQKLIEGFNENSPGRFDMFIEDVEIKTIMAFTPGAGTTLPTAIKFKIIEPYSVNGFIEALQVASEAAGYTDYIQSSFVLHMQFIGYPDNDQYEFKSPEIIPKSQRYFVFKFTGIEVEVSDRGTVYNCAAIPFNEYAFGQANEIKKPVTANGSTVHDILQNLFLKINNEIKNSETERRKGQSGASTVFDEYEIQFPSRVEGVGLDFTKINDIGRSPISEKLRDAVLPSMANPGSTDKPTGYQPNGQRNPPPQQQSRSPEIVKFSSGSANPQIQVSERQKLHEVIASVIRDSEFGRSILQSKKIEENGFVKYFMIKTEIKNKEEYDTINRKPFQKYVFVVVPYEVHFTKIPEFKDQKFDQSKLDRLSLREYNYIYQGNNVDVLNFKLNFNTLFFEAIPKALGNNDQPNSRDAAAKGNVSNVQSKSVVTTDNKQCQPPVPPVLSVATPVNQSGGNANQPQQDPYYTLARNMHESIINSNASMLTGDIDILGDPFFLVTGGIGNYNPEPGEKAGETKDKEADHLKGEVLITINFRNPIDINPLEKGGRMYFDSQKLPFSGVYQVTEVVSNFKDGVFKQKLNIIRVPGQIIDNCKPTDPNNKYATSPKPEDVSTQDTTRGINSPSQRLDEVGALNLLDRGLPSSGLPGDPSNFTNAAGGLGGQDSNLLSQVSGLVTNEYGRLTSPNQPLGSGLIGGINQLASGIRLQTAGLLDTVRQNLGPAASVIQASNALESSFAVVNAAKSLSTEIGSRIQSAYNIATVPGSGIGEGASILINKAKDLATTLQTTNQTVAASDLYSQTAELPKSITPVSGIQKSLSDSSLQTVQSLGDNSAKLVSEVGNKILNITAESATRLVSTRLGFDITQFAGLGSNLTSKVVDQVSNFAKNVPADTDLTASVNRGLILDTVPAAKIANIPATAPDSVAPAPAVDQKFLSEIAKSGGATALANAFGTNNISKIPGGIASSQVLGSALSQIPASLTNNLKESTQFSPSDITSLAGKISSADAQISNLVPGTPSIESRLSSINSALGVSTAAASGLVNTVAYKFGIPTTVISPLTKIMNR